MHVSDGLRLFEAEVLYDVGLERLRVDVLGEGGLAHRTQLAGVALDDARGVRVARRRRRGRSGRLKFPAGRVQPGSRVSEIAKKISITDVG